MLMMFTHIFLPFHCQYTPEWLVILHKNFSLGKVSWHPRADNSSVYGEILKSKRHRTWQSVFFGVVSKFFLTQISFSQNIKVSESWDEARWKGWISSVSIHYMCAHVGSFLQQPSTMPDTMSTRVLKQIFSVKRERSEWEIYSFNTYMRNGFSSLGDGGISLNFYYYNEVFVLFLLFTLELSFEFVHVVVTSSQLLLYLFSFLLTVTCSVWLVHHCWHRKKSSDNIVT